MRNFIVLLLLCAASSALAPPARAVYTTFLNNGPPSNRVDIVFLGDGYTASELGVYQTHINSMMNHFFNEGEEPFPRYHNYFNAHRIDVISQQSGADDPSVGYFVNTALDARYLYDGVTQRLLGITDSKANAALSSGLGGAFTADMRLVTVNATQYGGAGGTYAIYAGGNDFATEIALHELGHSFAGLADEYGGITGTYTGGEPSQPDLTKNSTGAKWSRWLGYDQPGIGTIGAYEGGGYYDHGLYRPSPNSKMRALGQPFDAIGREEIILDIYRKVDPLDAWLSNSQTLLNPADLWVDSIDPAIIQHEWYVNGSLVPGATDEQFNPLNYGFGPGVYTIKSHNFDPTDWVRIHPELLTQDVSWTVQYTVPEPTTIVLVTIILGCCLALKGRAAKAQGAALGKRRFTTSSPERAG
jgi:IgA Peptidase M64